MLRCMIRRDLLTPSRSPSSSESRSRSRTPRRRRVKKPPVDVDSLEASIRSLLTQRCECCSGSRKLNSSSCFQKLSDEAVVAQLVQHRLAFSRMHKLDQDRNVFRKQWAHQSLMCERMINELRPKVVCFTKMGFLSVLCTLELGTVCFVKLVSRQTPEI